MTAGARTAGQRGQALVFGLFVLIVCVAAMYLMLDAGAMVMSKVRLVNTADATAYSGAVMDARLMNFIAYTNRAMAANTASIGEEVSLKSWLGYASGVGTAAIRDPGLLNPAKYPAFDPLRAISKSSKTAIADLQKVMDKTEKAQETTVRTILNAASDVAVLAEPIERSKVMQEVADANYRNDGTVKVNSALTVLSLPSTTLLHHYTGKDRTGAQPYSGETFDPAQEKMRSFTNFQFGMPTYVDHLVARAALLRARSWFMPALLSACPQYEAMGLLDFMVRRGGLQRLSLDEWRSADTLGDFSWVPAPPTPLCFPFEFPAVHALSDSAKVPTRTDFTSNHYNYAPSMTPLTYALGELVDGNTSTHYSGLPDYWDLSLAARHRAPRGHNPETDFTVALSRPFSQTLAARIGGGALGMASAGPKTIVAVSSAGIFYRRPPDSSGQAAPHLGELANAFNPYWQATLDRTPHGPGSAVTLVQASMGVIMPESWLP